ncbi:MAG: efflux RND transporter permease subunit [Pseudomonadota bacterium]
MNGLIAWFARHPVAANLLMGFLLVAGYFSLINTPQKVFPEFTLDIVTVEVPYIGASPSEVEQSILQPLEQQLQGIEGVKDVTGTAAEGVGVVTLEFARGSDMPKAINDVKAEVDRITVFPDEAEEPTVAQTSSKVRVLEIGLFGDIPEDALRELAFRVKDDLSLEPAISLVEVTRARDYEISIEVSRDTLRAYDLTLADISAAIRRESLELPGGDLDTASEDILVRTLGRNLTRPEFEDIIIRTSAQDGEVRLKDVARVDDGFEERAELATFNGQPVVFIQVFRIGDEKVLDVAETAQRYLNETLNPSLPENVEAVVWRNDAQELDERIGLLIKNALIGLALVAIALSLFLDLRLAFWVTVGIGVSFIAAFLLMAVFGLSINQISMFGFILAIGIVVDDAIVVGENIFSEAAKGTPPQEAAVIGAQRVASPVIFAVSTTVCAFIPLLLLPGLLGKFLTDIPAIVIIILALSLVESLLILPRHLSHIDVTSPPKNPIFKQMTRLRNAIDGKLRAFVNGPLDSVLHFATRRWFVTLTGAVTTLVLAVGFLANGYIKFVFFPEIQANYVTASVEMPEGTPLEVTQKVVLDVQKTGLGVIEDLGGLATLDGQLVLVGAQDETGGPPTAGVSFSGQNEGSVVLELVAPDQRPYTSIAFERAWRTALTDVHPAAKVSVSSALTSLGFPVQVEVSAETDRALREVIQRTEAGLSAINGVYDIRNNYDAGKRELKVELRDEARSYDLSLESLAGQVRAAFFGNEALRVQRGRDEVRVYVRLPAEERRYIDDLYDLRIATPEGAFVPLEQVARVSEGLSPATISRINGQRTITITANVDATIVSGGEANAVLSGSIIPEIQAAIPDARFSFGGEAEEMADVGSVLGRNFAIALFAIFALLAIPFRSYLQPIIVMVAIPFGLIGAVIGHVVMDLNMGMLSVFGLVGLAGVVINGALVQVDFANEMRAKGMPSREAWVEAGKSRFRPIFLTALTTFLGVGPLMLETSVQAQFLVPMAASIAFGVLVGTAIQMLVVPALGAMLDAFGLDRSHDGPKPNLSNPQEAST